MPPRVRTSKPAEPADESKLKPRHAKADGPICTECWPNGWREHITSAGCIHGSWTRFT